MGKRGGKVYLGVEDVVEELDGVGARVNFTLYSDASGLGAADVKMAKGPAPKAKAGAAAPKAAAAATNGKPATSSAVAEYKKAAAKALAMKEKGMSKGTTSFSAGYQAAGKGRAAPQANFPPAKFAK